MVKNLYTRQRPSLTVLFVVSDLLIALLRVHYCCLFEQAKMYVLKRRYFFENCESMLIFWKKHANVTEGQCDIVTVGGQPLFEGARQPIGYINI